MTDKNKNKNKKPDQVDEAFGDRLWRHLPGMLGGDQAAGRYDAKQLAKKIAKEWNHYRGAQRVPPTINSIVDFMHDMYGVTDDLARKVILLALGNGEDVRAAMDEPHDNPSSGGGNPAGGGNPPGNANATAGAQAGAQPEQPQAGAQPEQPQPEQPQAGAQPEQSQPEQPQAGAQPQQQQAQQPPLTPGSRVPPNRNKRRPTQPPTRTQRVASRARAQAGAQPQAKAQQPQQQQQPQPSQAGAQPQPQQQPVGAQGAQPHQDAARQTADRMSNAHQAGAQPTPQQAAAQQVRQKDRSPESRAAAQRAQQWQQSRQAQQQRAQRMRQQAGAQRVQNAEDPQRTERRMAQQRAAQSGIRRESVEPATFYESRSFLEAVADRFRLTRDSRLSGAQVNKILMVLARQAMKPNREGRKKSTFDYYNSVGSGSSTSSGAPGAKNDMPRDASRSGVQARLKEVQKATGMDDREFHAFWAKMSGKKPEDFSRHDVDDDDLRRLVAAFMHLVRGKA